MKEATLVKIAHMLLSKYKKKISGAVIIVSIDDQVEVGVACGQMYHDDVVSMFAKGAHRFIENEKAFEKDLMDR